MASPLISKLGHSSDVINLFHLYDSYLLVRQSRAMMAISAFRIDWYQHYQSLPSEECLLSSSRHLLFFAGSDVAFIEHYLFATASVSWACHGDSWLYSIVSSTRRLRCLAAFGQQFDLAETTRNAAVEVYAVFKPSLDTSMVIEAEAVSFSSYSYCSCSSVAIIMAECWAEIIFALRWSEVLDLLCY